MRRTILGNIYRLVTLFIFCVVVVFMYAVPAYPGWQTRTLTDGNSVELQLIGDEFAHYWQTKDGRLAIEQTDGTFAFSEEPVPSAQQMRLCRQASPLHASRNARQTTSNPVQPSKVLVLLVEFADVAFQTENNNAAFQDLCNKIGYDYNGATGSAADYFKTQSNCQYMPYFDVIGPLTLPHNRAYYGEQGEKNGKVINDLYIADFVTDAVDLAEANGCDFSQYDSNNDGEVDIVYLIYAGQGQAAGGGTETIWPHNWTVYTALDQGFTHGTSGYYANKWYLGIDNLPTFDGKTINNYVCSAELNSSSNRSGIGTLCHEFGHVLGLPDYYDVLYGDNYTNGITPGTWSIMDRGSYNNDERTPPNYSIYDKYFLGWVTPNFLAKDDNRTLWMYAAYSDGYQITGGSTLLPCTTTTNTVYYIENRQWEGWDKYLPGHGMIVWKIQYDETAWKYNNVNTTTGAPRCTIVPADGRQSGYSSLYAPFPGFADVTSFTPFEGCALMGIYEQSEQIVFTYNGGGGYVLFSYDISGEHFSCPKTFGLIEKGTDWSMTFEPDEGYKLDIESFDLRMGGKTYSSSSGRYAFDESTQTLTVYSVTADILLEVIPARTITWMNGNEVYATNSTIYDMLILPDGTPEACEGYTFVGWTATPDYEDTEKPELILFYDDALQNTYYAVYAVAGEQSEQVATTYTFTDAAWTEATGTWESTQNANIYTDNQGVQVSTALTGIGAKTKEAINGVTQVVMNYCTNAKKGAGSITVKVGDSEQTKAVTSSGGTTLRDLVFDFDNLSGQVSFTVECTTNSIYINAVTVTALPAAQEPAYYTTTVNCDENPTGMENNQEPMANSQKLMKDGHLYIHRDGQIYTIIGQKVR